jgi:hypothetical protein
MPQSIEYRFNYAAELDQMATTAIRLVSAPGHWATRDQGWRAADGYGAWDALPYGVESGISGVGSGFHQRERGPVGAHLGQQRVRPQNAGRCFMDFGHGAG